MNGDLGSPRGPSLKIRGADYVPRNGGALSLCARYIGPLEHLRGMTALIYDEHPYRDTKGGAPSVGPDEIAAQFDDVAWRIREVHDQHLAAIPVEERGRVRMDDDRVPMGNTAFMEGPDECVLSACWHVFPAKDWEPL